VAGRGRNVAELRFLPGGVDLQLGDRLISSGMGGVFPKGLIIGDHKKYVWLRLNTPALIRHAAPGKACRHS
jgi:hypothetical protein